MIKRALISVFDKTGILDFSKFLAENGVEVISTGGTYKHLKENGVAVTEVNEVTNFPEMLDGRVKTLHPIIHAGILAIRDNEEHMKTIKERNIETIDMVIVNLYPFFEKVREDLSFEEKVEFIDIGGPTMLRAAAKNFQDVVVISEASDYEAVMAEIKETGDVSYKLRKKLAGKVFNLMSAYDAAISNFMLSDEEEYPEYLSISYKKKQSLRYGENPHQSAAYYVSNEFDGGMNDFEILNGKELSYNNLADADAAWECVKAFPRKTHACVIVKHANPCGVATGLDQLEAYEKAFQTDATSAFGGIMAFNQALDTEVIRTMFSKKHFVEVIIAPYVNEDAKRLLAEKPNIRVLIVPLISGGEPKKQMEMKRIGGGLLLQSADDFMVEENSPTLKVVSIKKPTPKEMQDMIFAMRVAKFIKSNAIVFCRDQMTLGIGAGQMSRVDSARIAAFKATEANSSLKNSVVASDAFFPFRDGLDVLAEFGASAVIQPGGSVRDDEVIAAANEHKIAMVFTGHRHFRH